MPIKVAFFQLSSCWGCHQSLLNAHLGLLPILPELEIVYWPAVVDFKHESLVKRKDGEIVVGFLEGVARTTADTENIKLMRKKCAIIVAIGTCACYGSVKGLANLFDKEELLNRKFLEAESITDENPKIPTEHIPEIEPYIKLTKDIIDVDVFLPGCPPNTDNIVAAISYLLALVGKGPDNLNKNECVCDRCNLFESGCFLDKNEMCYGSITAGGCELMCPNNGDVCYGCYRPTNKSGVKLQQLKSMIDNIAALTPEEGASFQHFLDLYLNVSNIANFYFRGDLIQRLAYEPESFKVKEIETNSGCIKTILDVEPTGQAQIDETIGAMLFLLKGDINFKYSSKTVCSHCDRDVVDKVPTDLKRDYVGLPTMDKCFLEQGYICLGPVTTASCGTICPNKGNAPCEGCFGPPIGIKDMGAKFISTLGSLCAEKDPDELMKIIKDPAGSFNRFTVAASTLGRKFHDKMEKE